MPKWRHVIAYLVFYTMLAIMIILWARAPVEPAQVDPIEEPAVEVIPLEQY